MMGAGGVMFFQHAIRSYFSTWLRIMFCSTWINGWVIGSLSTCIWRVGHDILLYLLPEVGGSWFLDMLLAMGCSIFIILQGVGHGFSICIWYTGIISYS